MRELEDMVAIDNANDVPASAQTAHTAHIVLFAFLGSSLLAAASLILNAASVTGWHIAAEMVSRFSLLLFVAAMLVEPLGRLLPFEAVKAAGRERGSLMLAFIGASVASLVCIVAPSQLGLESLTIPAVAYCGLTGMILVVMLFSAHPATIRFLGEPVWRTLQRISTAYFWVAFVLIGLDHTIGPHRPDAWPGFSLLLLTGAVLLRFTDAFLQYHRHSLAEKVG